MKKSLIPAILKKKRNDLELSPEYVTQELEKRGFSISTKTLYAYENGTNLPKVTLFLALCDIYNIRDVMSSFGYNAAICTADNDWEQDQYEDFFRASFLEKLHLLDSWGIPSFTGYEHMLEEVSVKSLSFTEKDMLHKFRQLDSAAQKHILEQVNYEFSRFSGESTTAAPAPKEA